MEEVKSLHDVIQSRTDLHRLEWRQDVLQRFSLLREELRSVHVFMAAQILQYTGMSHRAQLLKYHTNKDQWDLSAYEISSWCLA